MDRLSHMVDMSIEPRKEADTSIAPSVPDQPIYPYGLAISLDNDSLEKLDVDYSDWQVGDLFHLHAMARITSVSSNETTDGARCRVEMQIVALSGENEDMENAEEEQQEMKPLGRKRPY